MSKKESAVAKYIAKIIDTNGINQRDIADAVGWENPNMVSIIKRGGTKIPLDRVFPLARALELDPMDLFVRVMSEYHPGVWDEVKQYITGWILTQSEQSLVKAYRKKVAHGNAISPGQAASLADELAAGLKS